MLSRVLKERWSKCPRNIHRMAQWMTIKMMVKLRMMIGVVAVVQPLLKFLVCI